MKIELNISEILEIRTALKQRIKNHKDCIELFNSEKKPQIAQIFKDDLEIIENLKKKIEQYYK